MMTELDYDLIECLANNPQDFETEDIEKVLAVWEGANDGDDWRWILQLKNGQFVFLIGGCDYTGWDCRSYAKSIYAATAEAAATYCSDTTKSYNNPDVYTSIMQQLVDGKNKTWREQKDQEFGVKS